MFLDRKRRKVKKKGWGVKELKENIDNEKDRKSLGGKRQIRMSW